VQHKDGQVLPLVNKKNCPVWAGMPKLATHASVSNVKNILYYRTVGKSLPVTTSTFFQQH
jgi:hypothetical protein